MGECLSKPTANPDAYVGVGSTGAGGRRADRPERPPTSKQTASSASANATTIAARREARDVQRDVYRDAREPVTGVRPPNGRDRVRNDTVDFPDFKDRERNVVETMLESNKGLRMAELNFDDLKLQKIIGAGAFGEVIKGTYCGTPVVVKRMLRNKIDENNLRMFGDEIQLMLNLRHPNIVQFIGASWNSYSNM